MQQPYLYESRGAAELPQALLHTTEAARQTVAAAATRFIDTQQPEDYSLLRMAVCRLQTYESLEREAARLEAL